MPPLMEIDPPAKLKILQLEPAGCVRKVVAQFNPKEIQIDKAISWKKQEKKQGAADLEFTGGEPKTMSVELLFDGYESGDSVQPQLDDLEKMTMHFGSGHHEKRPPMVRVIWGPQEASLNLPTFTSVIESVSIKYTMFSKDGIALRATATVKLKQAERPGIGKPA